jgi:predicted dehydrogenase
MKKQVKVPDLPRRDFLKGGSFTALMMLMGGVEIRAQEKSQEAGPVTEEKPLGAAVKCALVGCGNWGREILKTLARLPKAQVVAICDQYEPFLRRAKESAPKADSYTDYRKILENKEILAVIIATPSHLHREITLAALQAGKHVYCEAPLANSIEDARAIAKAGKSSFKQIFQVGHQMRSDPQRHYLLQFIRAGAMGDTVMARSQWHKKQSWRFTSPNPAREKEINWRLNKELSIGLIGEIGIHQLDAASWFLMSPPVAVTGFGSVVHWKDGRAVPDTVQAVFEYPGGVNLTYDCTLANSFDADYEMYYGTDAAIMFRDNKAWMFKEVDAPLLGWEVYARKDSFYKETGIYLVANATKLGIQGDSPLAESMYTGTPLYYALEAFMTNTEALHSAVEDFRANFDEKDTKALKEYLASISKTMLPAAGYQEGFEAAVTAIKAHEAISVGRKLMFQKEWFEVG